VTDEIDHVNAAGSMAVRTVRAAFVSEELAVRRISLGRGGDRMEAGRLDLDLDLAETAVGDVDLGLGLQRGLAVKQTGSEKSLTLRTFQSIR
jgi:hypothetical protein